MTDAVRGYADYLFARNLALAIIIVFLLLIRSPRILAAVMVLVVLIQVLDVIDDLSRGDFVLVPGLLVFAIAFLIAASKLFGKAFWLCWLLETSVREIKNTPTTPS